MQQHRRRSVLIGLGSFAALGAAQARAWGTAFRLVPAASDVGFAFHVAGIRQQGHMPVLSAAITLDRANLQASSVDVSVDARRATTPVPFIAKALRGPVGLDADQHPTIRFVSTRIVPGASGRLEDGGRIDGSLTLRGQTRPISFKASLAGPAAGDQLAIRLTGNVSRSAFGSTKYPEVVSDLIHLDILATIDAA
ncbi:YceI family protein [Chachezhania antarctica]|uniref:YceI family protein n=1 Tax=Chachezhania antarctica TaxID=2340860 RepID=UPI000EB56C66|nr:YceI family protein [Chachezhania antarctica]|tara:strand:- start:3412 stop:3996 length:585 start_codon:yes stop_codon:yes gene_type:complete